jgi:hypothetical protein
VAALKVLRRTIAFFRTHAKLLISLSVQKCPENAQRPPFSTGSSI